MLLTVYNSKSDKYGNRYWAVQLTDLGKVVSSGTIAANNISTLDCGDVHKWEVSYIELPIREFNRLTKGWEYFGCTWDDIRNNLHNDLLKH